MMAPAAVSATRSLGELLPGLVPAEVAGTRVGPLQLDSRRVSAGDTFVALKGSQQDGADFVRAALAQGAALVLREAEEFSSQALGAALQVNIPGLRRQLSALAGRWYGEPSRRLKMVAVTGTNGKTTCVQWLAQLLDAPGQRSASVGTLGYGLWGEEPVATGMTTPDALETQAILARLQSDGASLVAMEVSSHSLDQGRVAGVDFDVAVVTNIGRDHLDYHGDLQHYIDSKKQLLAFACLQTAIINRDDDHADEFMQAVAPQARLLTYGLHAAADFRAETVSYRAEGIGARLHTPDGVYELQLPVWGDFNLHNLLAVLAAGWSLGFELPALIERLPQLQPVPGRLERVAVESDITVLVDFAHTPDALQSVLSAIRQHSRQRLWCVFGCGGDRDRGKRPLMAQVAETFADRVIVTSDNPRSEEPEQILDDIMAGFAEPQRVERQVDRERAIALAVQQAEAGDLIVVAGKGHEDYQQIGDRRLPFSDLAVARTALLARGGAA